MKQKQIVIILSITLVWVAFWIGFDIYDSITTSTISQDIQQQVIPLDSKFDDATIQKIIQRQQVTPIYDINGTSTGISNITPTVSPTGTSSLINNVSTHIGSTPSGTSSSQTAPAVQTTTGGLP